jgi:hypothetical protein
MRQDYRMRDWLRRNLCCDDQVGFDPVRPIDRETGYFGREACEPEHGCMATDCGSEHLGVAWTSTNAIRRTEDWDLSTQLTRVPASA